ncbi:hypothetical protein D3C83_98100 [compost metagenome]
MFRRTPSASALRAAADGTVPSNPSFAGTVWPAGDILRLNVSPVSPQGASGGCRVVYAGGGDILAAELNV